MPKKLEIEKKFIIAYPDEDYLKSLPECTYSDIEQIYLVCGDDTLSERIRKRGLPGDYKYYHTVKRHITAGTREESEELITEEEYEELKLRADPKLSAIHKTRYVIPYKGQILEIDVFPFWDRQAYLEVELEYFSIDPEIPDYIKCMCDVTADFKYSNHALAHRIPDQII